MGLTYSPLLPTSQLLGVQWAPNVFTVVTAGGGWWWGEGLGVPVPQRSSGKVLDGNF